KRLQGETIIHTRHVVSFHASRQITQSDNKRRHTKRLAYLPVRPLHLLDKLSVRRLHRKRRELNVCADNGNAPRVFTRKFLIPVLFQCLSICITHTSRAGQYATGLRMIAEEI